MDSADAKVPNAFLTLRASTVVLWSEAIVWRMRRGIVHPTRARLGSSVGKVEVPARGARIDVGQVGR